MYIHFAKSIAVKIVDGAIVLGASSSKTLDKESRIKTGVTLVIMAQK